MYIFVLYEWSQSLIPLPFTPTIENDTYLLYADHFYIGTLSVNGAVLTSLPVEVDGAFAVDFDYE